MHNGVVTTSTAPLRPGTISPRLDVPGRIARPHYVNAKPGTPADYDDPLVKDPATIERMRVAGRIAADALVEVGKHVAPGVTTDELDRIGHEFMIERDAYPSTLGYKGFRKSLSIKANSVAEGVVKLSGGNQQKVLLGKWMFPEPDLLILDEPTRGIDVGAKYEIYGLIQRLADAGKGVIVISSELPELLGLCDRIYTIFEGKITGVVDGKDATQENLMRLMTGATPAAAH